MWQALFKCEMPRLKLKSSRTYLAIKRCERTKIGKVIKRSRSKLLWAHICAHSRIPVNDTNGALPVIFFVWKFGCILLTYISWDPSIQKSKNAIKYFWRFYECAPGTFYSTSQLVRILSPRALNTSITAIKPFRSARTHHGEAPELIFDFH